MRAGIGQTEAVCILSSRECCGRQGEISGAFGETRKIHVPATVIYPQNHYRTVLEEKSDGSLAVIAHDAQSGAHIVPAHTSLRKGLETLQEGFETTDIGKSHGLTGSRHEIFQQFFNIEPSRLGKPNRVIHL